MRRYQIILYSLLAITLSGCNNYLDITPKGKVIPTSVQDFYDLMRDNNKFVPSTINGLLMTDEIKIYDDEVSRIFFKPERMVNAYLWRDYLYDDPAENDEDWNRYYAQIYVCNSVLDKIDDAPGDDEAKRRAAKGEALVHRAYAYLMLVNLYAKHYHPATAATDLGVPLHVRADINAQLGRASVQDVYRVIEDDLLLAVSLLPTESSTNYYPVQAAAMGLLAKAYLYQGNWEKAEDFADKALLQYSTLLNYNDFDFYPGMPQWLGLLNYPMRSFQNPEIILQKEYINNSFIIAVYMTDEHRALYDEGDRRLYFTDVADSPFGPNMHGGSLLAKDNFHREGVCTPELYLIRAEARARQGQADLAIADLNTLREKRFDTGKWIAYDDGVNADEALRLVLKERRVELFQEPWRWFDLKRLNRDPRFVKTLSRTFNGKTYTLAPDDHNYVLAIPKKVMDLNPNMVQNPRDQRN